MLRKIAFSVGILLTTGQLSHAITVYDPSRARDFLKEIAEVRNQVQLAKDQLEQARHMYESVTGDRGLGDLLSDRKIEDLLPKDMQNLYGDLNKNGITGSVEKILNSEMLTGSVDDMTKNIDERQRQSAAAQKALGLKAFEAAQQRLDQIENLRQQIGKAVDPKAMGELQARLQVEQSAIQSETNKLQLLQQMQVNEDKFIQMQLQELNRKILSSKNNQSPAFN